MQSQGIHHITMIASDPQRNIDFYAGLLGMRIVKISVNQDDPGTYHFFYGDASGKPGSDITFFPYPDGRRAVLGNGMVGEIRLETPSGSLDFWRDRFEAHGIDHTLATDEFGTAGLDFADGDGLRLRIVDSAPEAGAPWPDMIVPAEYAVVRSIGATLLTGTSLGDGLESKTGEFMERFLGMSPAGDASKVRRMAAPDRSYIDLVVDRTQPFGRSGHGGVHHIAFRCATANALGEAMEALESAGYRTSGRVDRLWFESLYFREPGGVLFELATDGPGFTTDESWESLGTRVSLPPWLEAQREWIERSLPKIEFPSAAKAR